MGIIKLINNQFWSSLQDRANGVGHGVVAENEANVSRPAIESPGLCGFLLEACTGF